VVAAARNRTQTPDGCVFGSPVQVLLLRPGDSLTNIAGGPPLLRLPGHAWPYGAGRSV
jgi:hypothetical protein